MLRMTNGGGGADEKDEKVQWDMNREKGERRVRCKNEKRDERRRGRGRECVDACTDAALRHRKDGVFL